MRFLWNTIKSIIILVVLFWIFVFVWAFKAANDSGPKDWWPEESKTAYSNMIREQNIKPGSEEHRRAWLQNRAMQENALLKRKANDRYNQTGHYDPNVMEEITEEDRQQLDNMLQDR